LIIYAYDILVIPPELADNNTLTH